MSERQEEESVCFQGKYSQGCSEVQLDVLTKATNTLNKNKPKPPCFLLCGLLKPKCDCFQQNCSNYQETCLLARLGVVLNLILGLSTAFLSLAGLSCEGIIKTHKKEVGGPCSGAGETLFEAGPVIGGVALKESQPRFPCQ